MIRPSSSPLTLLLNSNQENSICVQAAPLPSVELCEYASQHLSLLEEDTRTRLLKLWNRLSLSRDKDAQMLSNNDFDIWARLVEQICFDEIENSKSILQLEREEQIYFDTLKFIELGIASKEAVLSLLFGDVGNVLTGYHLTLSLYRNNLTNSYGQMAIKSLLANIAPKMKMNLDLSGFIKTSCLNRPGSPQSLRRIMDGEPPTHGFCGIPLVNPLSLKELSGDEQTNTNVLNSGRGSGSDNNTSSQNTLSSLDYLGNTPTSLLYKWLTRYATQGVRLVADATPYSLLNQPKYRRIYNGLNYAKNIKNFSPFKYPHINTFSASSMTSSYPNSIYFYERSDKSIGDVQFPRRKGLKRHCVGCRCCKALCDCCVNFSSESLFTLSDTEDEEVVGGENNYPKSCKSMLENLKMGRLASGQPAMSRAELSEFLTKDGFDFLKPAFVSKIISML